MYSKASNRLQSHAKTKGSATRAVGQGRSTLSRHNSKTTQHIAVTSRKPERQHTHILSCFSFLAPTLTLVHINFQQNNPPRKQQARLTCAIESNCLSFCILDVKRSENCCLIGDVVRTNGADFTLTACQLLCSSSRTMRSTR